MRKIILHVAIGLFFYANSFGQTNPLITSWQLNTTGATGYMGYTTNVKQVLYSATSVYIKTNDIADYIPVNAGNGMGQVDWWPNNPWFPDSMGYTFRFRLNPTPNTGVPRKPPYGHVGVWRNGVSIYSPLDAKSYNNDTTWFQNAFFWEHLLLETFDSCWGHPNGSKEYHTHQSPACVYDQTDSLNHSPIIGFAFDGYPIYGCYGYANTNGTGAIKRMRTSYRLRNIAARTTLPDGTVLPPSLYGPIVDPSATNIPPNNQSPVGAPLGAYQEDYEYIAGLGDLDDHNGRFCITPEYPSGIYAYFVTLDSTLTPVFPYALGLTYYGTIIQQDGNMGPNSGFVTINETVTNYIPATTAIEQTKIEIEFEVYPNPASDQITFLLKSNDFTSVMKGEIYNQNGKLVISGDVNTNRNYAFNTSNLEAGVYFLKITTDNKIYSTKFIVTK
ncbi:MAG: YHYH protein [Saprospiraceae bacterium]|nr:YHYH protein [Saprospiraceae bacterium]